MIEIEAPDGSVVEFPEGTSDEVIVSAMQATFGGPSQSNSALKADQIEPDTGTDMLKSAGAGLRSGLEALAGTPGDMRELGLAIAGWISKKHAMGSL